MVRLSRLLQRALAESAAAEAAEAVQEAASPRQPLFWPAQGAGAAPAAAWAGAWAGAASSPPAAPPAAALAGASDDDAAALHLFHLSATPLSSVPIASRNIGDKRRKLSRGSSLPLASAASGSLASAFACSAGSAGELDEGAGGCSRLRGKASRGVRFQGENWQARTKRNGREVSLGLYNSAEEAGMAYDLDRLAHQGGKAQRLNYPLLRSTYKAVLSELDGRMLDIADPCGLLDFLAVAVSVASGLASSVSGAFAPENSGPGGVALLRQRSVAPRAGPAPPLAGAGAAMAPAPEPLVGSAPEAAAAVASPETPLAGGAAAAAAPACDSPRAVLADSAPAPAGVPEVQADDAPSAD